MLIPRHRSTSLWTLLLLAAAHSAAAPSPCLAQTGKDVAAENAARPVGGDPAAGEQPKKRAPIDLSSPRATMRSFLLAIQDADAGQPERIDDAVACLDTSKLDGEDVAERRRLARRLYVLIDARGVKLDDIPQKATDPEWTFFTRSSPEGESKSIAIVLAKGPGTVRWRFSSHTLDSIPLLERHAAEHKKEVVDEAAAAVAVARRTPRATMETFLQAMSADSRAIEEAVQCLNPASQKMEAWDVLGRQLAVKLKNVMDKVEKVVLTDVPGDADGPPYIWYTSDVGSIVIGRIEEEGTLKGEWRFTPQTLATLDALYKVFETKDVTQELQDAGIQEELTLSLRVQRMMPAWLRVSFLGLEGWKWVALLAMLPVGYFVKLIGSVLSKTLLRGWARSKGIEVEAGVQRRTSRTIGTVFMTAAWWCVIRFDFFDLPAGCVNVLLPATSVLLILTSVWVAYRLVDILGGHIAANNDVRITRFDDVLIPLLRTILRFVIVIVAGLIILEWLGQKPTTILGALGIGGVAVAFAAQDTIGNFFGSITVLLDRPFGIGDWITIGDVEGTVERVGFRSTRVRTFYNSMITIPNSKMTNTHVDNYGAREYRRVRIMISITYDTQPEKIDAFCEGIRELIRLHPYTRKDYYHVYLNQFAASSLDILLYAFFEVPDWSTELRERHRLFMDIMRLARKLGIEFAFPTRTVWLEKTGEDAPDRNADATGAKADPNAHGVDHAARVFAEAYGEQGPSRSPVVIDTSPISRKKSS